MTRLIRSTMLARIAKVGTAEITRIKHQLARDRRRPKPGYEGPRVQFPKFKADMTAREYVDVYERLNERLGLKRANYTWNPTLTLGEQRAIMALDDLPELREAA